LRQGQRDDPKWRPPFGPLLKTTGCASACLLLCPWGKERWNPGVSQATTCGEQRETHAAPLPIRQSLSASGTKLLGRGLWQSEMRNSQNGSLFCSGAIVGLKGHRQHTVQHVVSRPKISNPAAAWSSVGRSLRSRIRLASGRVEADQSRPQSPPVIHRTRRAFWALKVSV
jgi:hypothetical protein